MQRMRHLTIGLRAHIRPSITVARRPAALSSEPIQRRVTAPSLSTSSGSHGRCLACHGCQLCSDHGRRAAGASSRRRIRRKAQAATHTVSDDACDAACAAEKGARDGTRQFWHDRAAPRGACRSRRCLPVSALAQHGDEVAARSHRGGDQRRGAAAALPPQAATPTRTHVAEAGAHPGRTNYLGQTALHLGVSGGDTLRPSPPWRSW